MALGISRTTAKSQRARERGRWGRLSVDGPGHYNPDRSEGPWGRAAWAAQMAVRHQAHPPALYGDKVRMLERAKGGCKPRSIVGRRRLKGQP